MKKIIFNLIAFVVILSVVSAGCTTTTKTGIKVTTSTSLLTYIVEQVGGKHVDVIQMVPPNQHPGNFDAKPGDIEKLATAKLFILHGWPGETYADELIAAANNSGLTIVKANVNGNWMIPSVQSAATDKVVAILSEVDPANAANYRKAGEAYKLRISAEETAIRTKLTQAKVTTVNVIASARQADFLQWAGFNVVANFQSPQALTPQVVKDMVDTGNAQNVTLVINNLQDGQDAGKAVAEELGAQDINLSNFPGGLQNTETWEKAIEKNIQLLINAIK
jgi:zinc transport system substrate-binding protein